MEQTSDRRDSTNLETHGSHSHRELKSEHSTRPKRLVASQYLPLRREQATMAAILIICVIAMGFYFWHRNIVENGLIDVDRAPPVELKYLVNINDAPWPAIANLPGIGKTLAQEIVEYRDEIGTFDNIDDIKNIRGIGDSKLDGIREFIAPIGQASKVGTKHQQPNLP